MHGNGGILLEVSKTLSRLNVKQSCGSYELKMEEFCDFGIKRTFRRDRNWVALHLSNLSWVSYYISPRWIDISLLIITWEHLTGCEALLRCQSYQSYRFIVKWITLLNSWLSCKVDSCGVWLNFEWMSKPNLSNLCQQAAKALFSFSNYIPLWSCFQRYNYCIFETKHRYQLQPEGDIRWALVTTGSYFDKLLKQTQG